MIDMEALGLECVNGLNTDVFEEKETDIIIFL